MRALLKHPLLDCDLEEAALWYHRRNPAIAERLIDEAQRIMRRIAEAPELFPIRFEDVHRAKLPGFPHSLYFTVTAESPLIHGARDLQAMVLGRRTPDEN